MPDFGGLMPLVQGARLLVKLQLLHVCNDSLVLSEPATVHVCTPL